MVEIDAGLGGGSGGLKSLVFIGNSERIRKHNIETVNKISMGTYKLFDGQR